MEVKRIGASGFGRARLSSRRAARAIASFALSALLVSGCVAQGDGSSKTADKPFGELISDVGYSSVSGWLDALGDDEKAMLELAYEDAAENGHAGSLEEWVTRSVVAHRDVDGDVVVVLPDGGQFTVRPSSADSSSDADPRSSSSTSASQSEGKDSTDGDSSKQVKGMGAILSVDSVEGNVGATVDVPVTVENNPGILGLEFTVSYDDTSLELVSADNGEAVKSVLHMTSSRNMSTGCKFTWDGLEISSDEVKDGSVLVMHFKVKPDAQKGFHSVVLRNVMAVNNDLEELPLACEEGGVAVG